MFVYTKYVFTKYTSVHVSVHEIRLYKRYVFTKIRPYMYVYTRHVAAQETS